MASPPPEKKSLTSLGGLRREAFVELLGGIYESSPWVAEGAFLEEEDYYESATSLAKAMRAVVSSAPVDRKVELLRAHPDLAGRAKLSTLTAESQSEQKSAGLDALAPEDLVRFRSLNDAYRSKFGWPFIFAVRNATAQAILRAFERRVDHDPDAELRECVAHVHRIAWTRLLDVVHWAPTGFLTSHVLDTANGIPARGMRVELTLPSGDTRNFLTNDDGRLDAGAAIRGADFQPGAYEWHFHVGEYFAALDTAATLPPTPFLDVVPLRFGVDNPELHYHVPLLCSPWSFSTYRGS
mmetsp:Transcript_38553/g.123569  ORF Transcript_38553/g.123569 Transcript_38553/m.123569 type:complete len:296 (+) Transcript_38553:61-948(+)|eukprot:CAMPEP_0118901898 /NCGR_PEP_ID=MMETSP1166-20130328/7423_1 /TAXON_ID=1104430 /ORGANISM="Chrysoreinhardia sp, Strain CCMP3193" /LENGTH=295 /DNA_ID=CAMNT_0006841089 /DNA_START=26 /DNA_END=913 /DNA_ORIENTATION=+